MTICSSFLSFSSIIIYHFHIFHKMEACLLLLILSFFIHRCGFVGLCCLLPVLSNWYFTFTVEKAIRNLMRLRAQVKNVQIMKWNDLPYLIGCQDLLIQTIQTYILEERKPKIINLAFAAS
jgi:hypothetical protein